MVIDKNTVVTLHYKLQKDNESGELVEETFGNQPLVFLYGVGQMIPEFERQLEGKQAGDEHSFGIPSADAYGEVNPQAVVQVPKESFMVDGKLAEDVLKIGNRVPMMDQNGNRLNGLISAIGDEAVTVDFNHPMAGQDLFFSIQVESVREATPEEIDHGHVHGPGGVQH